MLIHLLKCGENELLGLFEVAVVEMRKELPDDIEVDFLPSGERCRYWKRYVRLFRVSHSATLPAVSRGASLRLAAV
jgi:hypothetical protein